MSRFSIKEGATLPTLQAELSWDGGPADLSTASLVKVRLSDKGVTTEFECNIVDAAENIVKYEWQATDTETLGAGIYKVEWVVTFPNNVILVCPSSGYNSVVITKNL